MLLCNIFLLKVKWIKFMWCWVFHSLMFLIFNLLQWKCRVLDFIKTEGSRIHFLYSSRGFKAQGKSSCKPFSSDNYFVLLLHSYWSNIHGTHAWKLFVNRIILQPSLTQGQSMWWLSYPYLDFFSFFWYFIDSQNNLSWKAFNPLTLNRPN